MHTHMEICVYVYCYVNVQFQYEVNAGSNALLLVVTLVVTPPYHLGGTREYTPQCYYERASHTIYVRVLTGTCV